jgi:hypothetical protein
MKQIFFCFVFTLLRATYTRVGAIYVTRGNSGCPEGVLFLKRPPPINYLKTQADS